MPEKKQIRKLLADIGYTLEVMEDYVIDKQTTQIKKHFYHLKNAVVKLGELLSKEQ